MRRVWAVFLSILLGLFFQVACGGGGAKDIPPTITAQPADAEVIEGASATFTVQASGTPPLTYQWRKNGVELPGATAATYQSPATLGADGGATFAVEVRNGAGNATSRAALLTVNVPPRITAQPADAEVIERASATFTVEASGTPPLAYQWRKNGVELPGATGVQWTLPVVALEDAGTYDVLVLSPFGGAQSRLALLDVREDRPIITAQPRNWVLRPGQSAEFAVTVASVGPLHYQWRRGGVPIPGATGPSHRVSEATTAEEGSYDVVAGNARATVASAPAYLALVRESPRLAAGAGPNLFVDGEGSVWVWGSMWDGLGDGVTGPSTVPVKAKDLDSVVTVDAGLQHCLALKVDGSVWAWGTNVNGEVGNGGESNQPTPIQLQGLGPARAIYAGHGWSMALLGDGTAKSWGHFPFGSSRSPVPVPGLSEVVTLAMGTGHGVALRPDGTVWAWGYGYQGELGRGIREESETPVLVPGLHGIVALASGWSHNLALRNDGTVWAWGEGTQGALGDGASATSFAPVRVLGLEGIVGLGAGWGYSLALSREGTVWAWGANPAGQLGDGTTLDRPLPVRVPGLTDVRAIAAADNHAFALASDGSVWGWGQSDYGHLGFWPKALVPVRVPGLINTRSLSASYLQSMALGLDGRVSVWGWGRNQIGRMWISPFLVPGLEGVRAVNSGAENFHALPEDGSLWAWGVMAKTGTLEFSELPLQVADWPDVLASSVYGTFALAARGDGSLWSWGNNFKGRLGDGTTQDHYSPAQVQGFTGAVDVGTGAGHGLALKANGSLWSWGWNAYGQLGDGTQTDRLMPGPVLSMDDVSTMAAGVYHNLAVKRDGTVWAWGANWGGQLGDGTFTDRLSPVQVEGVSSVTAVAVGTGHSLALKSDGTVWAWGWGNAGRLGDGTEELRSSPIQVPGLGNAVGIAAGIFHSLALQADGSVWAWGWNGHGQLGLPDVGFRLSPMLLAGIQVPEAASAPAILQQPQSLALNAGQRASFSVQASGSLPLAYQWRRNGVALPGADFAVLTLPSVTSADAGDYDVVVTNAQGRLQSLIARLTVATPPLDLWIEGLYVTQAVQDPAGGVPLVQGREALLRVFVRANTTNAVRPDVRVKIYQGGTLQRTEVLGASAASVPLYREEGNLAGSWNLRLSAAELQPGLAVVAEVDPAGILAEGEESNNAFPLSGGPQVLDVRTPPPFRVTLFPVRTGDGRMGGLDVGNLPAYTVLLNKVFPLSEVDEALGPTFATSTVLGSNGEGWVTLLSELEAKRTVDASTRHYYGVVNPAYSGGVAGIGYVGHPVALGWDQERASDQGDRSGVFAHELGHNFNRLHAPCGGASDVDPAYPYAGGVIGRWGWDAASNSLKDPAVVHDLMGYCANLWISDHVYSRVLEYRATSPAGLAPRVPSPKVPSLLVWGHAEGGKAILEPAFTLDLPPKPILAGTHRIRLLDASGGLLREVPFQPEPVADLPAGEGRSFALVLPLADLQADRIAAIEWVEGGKPLARRVEAPAQPKPRPRMDGPRFRWDAEAHPAVLLRDPATGELLGLGRGGELLRDPRWGRLELHFSNGLRSAPQLWDPRQGR